MGARSRRRSLARDGSTGGSGSFYGYIGDLRNAFDPHSGLLKSWHQVLFGFQAQLPTSSTAFRAFYLTETFFCADFYVKLNTGFYEAVLRIWRVPGYLSNLDDVYAKRFRALKSFKVLVVTAFMAHLVACGRFAFGSQRSVAQDPGAWLPPTALENETLGTRYVSALFWSVGIITGAFEGALPRLNAQFAFTLAVALLGLVLFIYACSTLFMLSKSESSQAMLAQARISQLRHLLTFHHVPESLQTEAVEYLKRHYTDAESNDREVVKLLCPSITKDIQVELLKDMVGRIPLFRSCNEQFIVALTSLLEMTSCPANVTLFQAGDQGEYILRHVDFFGDR
uniref:Cyclic nucleotide-binding domain-containing protein n=1 Tax=Phytophthora ramorum TaxID=164328 RepID=H3GR41_PHYRM